MISAIIQARMSSARFPGKTLHSVCGKPMLDYLLESLARCTMLDSIVVATSTEDSDDPVAAHCRARGIACHRGPLADVSARFVETADRFGVHAFVRLCGDSPLLDHRLVDHAVGLFALGRFDLVTNIATRTFPKGQSVEVVDADTYRTLCAGGLSTDEREHVTRRFYTHPDDFSICSFQASAARGELQLSVDTPRDMARFQALAQQFDRPHWEYRHQEIARMAEALETDPKPLGVGVIGLGVGGNHILAYAAHPRAKVLMTSDFDAQKRRKLKEAMPEVEATEDAAPILTSPDIDIVSIASFDNFHLDQAVTALEHGKHVLVEKPMVLHPSEAKTLRNALRAHPEARLSSNLPLRTCPRFSKLRDAYRCGILGSLYSMEADYFWGRTEKLTSGWRPDMEFYSIIHGAAVHMIDLIMWITGMRPVEVRADGNAIATAGSALRYNDFASCTLRFEKGFSAKVSAHGGCVHPHFHRVAAFGTKKTFCNEFTGAYWLDSCRPDTTPAPENAPYPARSARAEVIASFVDNILDPASPPLVSAEDAFDTMAVCFAAEEAAHTGKPVTINYE